jgi:hypothetical protein
VHLHEGEGKLLGALAREELSAVMMLENGQLLEVWARYWESGGARVVTMERSTLDTLRSLSAEWREHHGRPVYIDEAKFRVWLDRRYGPTIPRPLTLLEALERYSDPEDWATFIEIERAFVVKGYAASVAAAPVLYIGTAPPGYPELFRQREAVLKKLDDAFKARVRRGGFRITGFQYRRGDVPFETEIPARQVAILHFDYGGSTASGGGLEYSGIELEEAPSARVTPLDGAKVDRAIGSFSEAKLRDWYQKRAATWPMDRRSPSRDEDWTAAREVLGDGVPRDMVRRVRRDLAPEQWTRKARRKTGGRKTGDI